MCREQTTLSSTTIFRCKVTVACRMRLTGRGARSAPSSEKDAMKQNPLSATFRIAGKSMAEPRSDLKARYRNRAERNNRIHNEQVEAKRREAELVSSWQSQSFLIKSNDAGKIFDRRPARRAV